MKPSVLRIIQRLFLWTGIVILAFVGSTTAYSEAFQRYQARKFDQAVRAQPKNIDASAVEDTPDLHEGDVFGRLDVPRIGLSVMVLQGAEESTLLLGVGHVPGTPLPGVKGNVVLAGHRDTFFRKLSGIMKNDRIEVSTATRRYQYMVTSTEIVDPQNTRMMESGSGSELTLITCYPFYYVGSAPKRFIVHAVPR